MNIDIREMRGSDYDDWQRLWTGCLDCYESTLPEATNRHAFDRLSAEDSACHGFLATEQDRPVGLVHYIFHEHMWRPEGVCCLQDLYCDPTVRGIGVGRALIEAVYKAADAGSVPRVYWLTQDFNATARRLYDRIGKLSPFIKYDRA